LPAAPPQLAEAAYVLLLALQQGRHNRPTRTCGIKPLLHAGKHIAIFWRKNARVIANEAAQAS
jgi:hypothetical protein